MPNTSERNAKPKSARRKEAEERADAKKPKNAPDAKPNRARTQRSRERAGREAEARADAKRPENARAKEAEERAARKEAEERAQREAAERVQRDGPAPRHRRRAPWPALLVGALVIGAGAAGALIPQHADDPSLPRGPSTAELKHLSVRLSPDWPQPERVDLGEAAPVAVVASLPSGSRVTVATIAKYTDLRDPLPASLRPAGVTPQPWRDNGLPLLKYEGKRDDGELVYAYVALFADGPEVIACSAPSAAALKFCVRDLATVRSSRPPLSVVLDKRLQATVIRELRRVANARRDARPILRRRYLGDRIGGLTKLVTAYAAAQRNIEALSLHPADRAAARQLRAAVLLQERVWRRLRTAARESSRTRYNARRDAAKDADEKMRAAVRRFRELGYVKLS